MPLPESIVVLDSVTHLEARHKGMVAYCASHGGTYSAHYAAEKGIGALILNDAGIGRERAGVAGLHLLDGLGVPAAAISVWSARIGDGQDGVTRGVISVVNARAHALGVAPGMACAAALMKLLDAAPPPARSPAGGVEFRFEVPNAGGEGIRVIVMDSMSLVSPDDVGHIVVAASHGGILGGKPETAAKHDVFAAVVNDAGRGIDDAGLSRLPALDARGIAAACVSAFSARIGDGRSMWEHGYISAVNETARRHGGLIGVTTREFVGAMVAARVKQQA